MNRRVSISCLLLAVLIFAAGCPGPGTHDPGYVAKEWSMTMREFGIVPVFPPREDVQVGDLYISPTSPDKDMEMRVLRKSPGEFLPIPVLVDSVDVRRELNTYYSRRLSFPVTSTAPSTQPQLMMQPHGSSSIFKNGDATRLRLGGFPEFFSTQISQGGVDGLVPTEAVDIAFGAFASANKRVRVSVPMVESYGLPAEVVLRKLTATRPITDSLTFTNLTGDQVALEGKDLAQYFIGNKYASTENGVAGYLRLIIEVYTTRSIDVSVEAELGRSGGLNVNPTPNLLGRIPSLSAKTRPSSQPTTQQLSQPVDFDPPTPQQVAASLNNQLNESLQNSMPGVTVKFVSVTAYGVTMRRTYERPIAIGYRAVLLKIKCDGKIELAGISSSAIPVKAMVAADVESLQDRLSAELSHRIRTSIGGSSAVTVQLTGPLDALPDHLTATVTGVPERDHAEAEQLVRTAIAEKQQAATAGDVLKGIALVGVKFATITTRPQPSTETRPTPRIDVQPPANGNSSP